MPPMPQIVWKPLVLTLLACICLADHSSLDAYQEAPAPDEEAEVAPSAIPLEESPLLFEPQTPEEHFDAVVTTVNLARLRLARQYLERFLALDPDEETLLALRDKYGPAPFLNFANQEELRPLSQQLLDRVNAAVRRRASDPARIDALIDNLAGTVQQRVVAFKALRNTGPIVVPRILLRVAEAPPGGRDVLVEALTRLGRQAVPPLLGALDSPNEDVRAAAVTALGVVGSSDVAPYLWFPAFGPDQPTGLQLTARRALARLLSVELDYVDAVTAFGVSDELRKLALQHYRRQHPWALEEGGGVTLWTWSPEAGTVVPAPMPPETASLFVGTRFARQALAMTPEKSGVQALFLGLALALETQQANQIGAVPTGPGTAYNLALSSGDDVVAETLALALETGNGVSALGALQALGQIGTKHQLFKVGRQAPLLAALNYPDPRVQFAAAGSILQLDPERPFRSADRVVDILARALTDTGTSQVLVIDPDSERAATLAGLIGPLGYEPQTAQTGQAGFKIATDRMDIGLVLVHINTIRWPLSQMIANFRADARTARLPIVIYGPEAMQGNVQRLIARTPLTTYLVESSTTQNIEAQLRPFLESIRTPPLTPEQRVARRQAAAYWLAHIANGQRTNVFDLAPAQDQLIQASRTPGTVFDSLRALGAVPTVVAQQHLQILAVDPQIEPDVRETAALQLAFHIQQFGLLLTKAQVLEVETQWRAENHPDVATALASVVGSLKPNAARVTNRLQNFTPPIVPVPAPTTP